MLFKWWRRTLWFAVINFDMWQWQTHLGDTDGCLSDIKLIFPVTLSSQKVWRKFVKSTSRPVHSSVYSLAFSISQIRTCPLPVYYPAGSEPIVKAEVTLRLNLRFRKALFILSLYVVFPPQDPVGIGLPCCSRQSKCRGLPQKDKTPKEVRAHFKSKLSINTDYDCPDY